MNDDKTGIYLIVNFDWPQPFEPKYGELAYTLHKAVQGQGWVREVLAASGGIGGKQSSIWVFWLESYGALDKLLADKEEPIGKAYRDFFSAVESVEDKIREEVRFS